MPTPLNYGNPIPLKKRRRFQRFAITTLLVIASVAAIPLTIKQFIAYRLRRQHQLNDDIGKAVEAGDATRVQNLYKSGAQINATDNGISLLSQAIKQKNSALVNLLLADGADVNVGSSPPLVFAMENDDTSLAELLISRGANVNGRVYNSPNQDALLNAAVQFRHPDFVRLLLGHGADPNISGQYGFRPLHTAVEFEYTESLNLLLAAGANADATDADGQAPLYWAAWRNENDIAAILIAHGAKPTIWSAVAFGDLPAVKKFLHVDPSLSRLSDQTQQNTSSGKSLLYLAAMNARPEVFQYLLTLGADINAKDREGETILHAAAQGGDVTIIRHLLDAGINVNAVDAAGETPLHETTFQGRVDAARFLIDHGANAQPDTDTITPLDWAISYNHSDLVDLLLTKGAKLKPTSLHDAITYADLKMVEFLVSKGADINGHDDQGRTPLHMAMSWHKSQIADFLLAHGADPTARTSTGKTPADLAKENQ